MLYYILYQGTILLVLLLCILAELHYERKTNTAIWTYSNVIEIFIASWVLFFNIAFMYMFITELNFVKEIGRKLSRPIVGES